MSNANERQIGGNHYGGTEYQHWDWVTDIRLPYLSGVGSKYAFRWRNKDGIQDLEKALHYIDKAEECGIRGSVDGKRMDKFWRFVLSNDVCLRDAVACYYFMEGDWPAARATVQAILAAEQVGQERST